MTRHRLPALCWSLLCTLLLASVPVAHAAPESAADQPPTVSPSWPQVLTSGTTELTIYQPQLDNWDGYTLIARAAVEATGKDGKSTYGIVQFSAHTLVDKATRWVALDQYTLIKADFPSSASESKAWVAALQKDAAGRKKTIALDQLEAAVGVLAAEQKADSAPIDNTPPAIINSEVPAMLVYIDGEPAYRPVDGTSLQRVINTRPLLLKDAQGKHYLHVFDGWMVADGLNGSYAPLPSPGADLEKARKAAIQSRQVDLLTGQSDPKDKIPTLAKPPVPKIYIATAPNELLVTDGPAQWQPIQGTQLLYVSNTTGHIFKQIGDQNSYVLISGRWFRASDMNGPWTFTPADKLPADFTNIPDDSPKENVKASVAGTPQAREAAIAATIPQTSAIKKSAVKMTAPQFDGEPQLNAIGGTSLQYVVNSSTPIIMLDSSHWYAVENGIWFSATAVQGPWAVASSVPAVIYSIPPSSPMHYLTYVKVYEVSGDTVVVGYTPGYQGSTFDPNSGVVVYGTGYPYTPWVGNVWYGPPVTYGFGVAIRYTPWTGWTFGFGFGWSWGGSTVAMGWGWGAYPWWGNYGWGYAWGPHLYPAPLAWGGAAYGYHGGAVAWGPGGWAGTTGNIYRQWGDRASVSRYGAGYNAWTGNRWAGQVGNAYNSRTGVAAAGQRGAVGNVFTGRYAAGHSGSIVGPEGGAIAGGRVTAGNVRNGTQVSANRGAVYNPNTGNTTQFGGVRGRNGGAAQVGGNVYVGHDGNVYRKTDNGWQSMVKGGATRANASAQLQNLDRESAARNFGNQRLNDFHTSSRVMNHSFGGGGGFHRR
ncbi:autotransporter [Pseudomonas sp. SZMC_28357]|uniref:autotransporter n=1 Tax=Pseudomonas sp. SZMC_28357 TaxID=3074380 RepID=UPI0028721BC5|nr:autotransporter [Pseudomonas sp. SZMC_28357]MDR9753690.1 autotransporter [Pseudomonas sp. SZMC_28357]